MTIIFALYAYEEIMGIPTSAKLSENIDIRFGPYLLRGRDHGPILKPIEEDVAVDKFRRHITEGNDIVSTQPQSTQIRGAGVIDPLKNGEPVGSEHLTRFSEEERMVIPLASPGEHVQYNILYINGCVSNLWGNSNVLLGHDSHFPLFLSSCVLASPQIYLGLRTTGTRSMQEMTLQYCGTYQNLVGLQYK